jgi:hypothetical protein
MNDTLRMIDTDLYEYRRYAITGNPRILFVCIAPYGAFSPKAYGTIEEAKAAIDDDIAAR